jgi:Ala-tRNA(Pro) deacylase
MLYLYVMPGDKPFSTKDFGAALQISRVSFAPAAMLQEFLGTEVGATTPLSLVADVQNRVRLIIDKAAVAPESVGCPDGTTTCYMRIGTADLLQKYIPATNHVPTFI